MNVLLVVESPIKAKKFRGYFPEYNVIATVGHFKDLPPDRMGVEPPHHKPEWVVMDGKKKVESDLRAAGKKADVIYIATDPDREGEAIAAHVANTLGNALAPKIARITYNEVSKAAIAQAIKQKRAIDWQLVRAQEARRVLDRYVGYQVSPELTDKLKAVAPVGFLTSGRVISVAVKLVVEREEEIKRFVPIKHYGIAVSLEKSGIGFFANWKPPIKPDQLVTDRSIAQTVVDRTPSLKVVQIDNTPKNVAAPKPLTTSSYVRLMASALKLTTKQAMEIAQELFHAGLITYHRTDSPFMSPDAVHSIRDFAKRNQLPIPITPKTHKASANAQEGHECLRVTDIGLMDARTKGITDTRQLAAYNLVWKVTLESQLADGVDTSVAITFHNAHKDVFMAYARTVKEAGWRYAATKFAASDDARDAIASLDKPGEPTDTMTIQSRLPSLVVGDQLRPLKVDLQAKVTKAPERFTEKTLVEKLDKLGIGRPSTYASTMERIIAVSYVTRASNLRLDPTPRGVTTKLVLEGHFSFMDYGYTARMEESFDLIAQRKTDYLTVVSDAWEALKGEIGRFKAGALPNDLPLEELRAFSTTLGSKTSKPANKPKPAKSTAASKPKAEKPSSPMPGNKCSECGTGTLSTRKFKEGGKNAGQSFIGCSNFPTCRFFSWPH